MKTNKKGYSVLISLLVIGFLLLLVVGIFNLILKEFNDTRALGDYYKAYYGAEAAQELALLEVKEIGYATDSKIDFDINDKSVLLSKNPEDKSLFNQKNEVYIGYNLDTKTNTYSGKLDSLEYDIIPLFYINNETEVEYNSKNIRFSILSGNTDDMAWNIVSSNGIGISGTGIFDSNTFVKMKNVNSSFINKSELSINNFLTDYSTNYLILFNMSDDNVLNYKIENTSDGEYFTKPRTYIISRSQVGDYRQNILTYLNNTEYLNILKYSIHSK